MDGTSLALGQQLGQAVQGLRAEDHIHVGRALDDGRASWLATQPPTPIARPLPRGASRGPGRRTPFPAPSRTEQVLNRIRSASSGLSVGS